MEDQAKSNQVHSAGLGRERSAEEQKAIQQHEQEGQEQLKNEEETLGELKKVAGEDAGLNEANIPSTTVNDDTVGKQTEIPPAGSIGTAEEKKEEVIQ